MDVLIDIGELLFVRLPAALTASAVGYFLWASGPQDMCFMIGLAATTAAGMVIVSTWVDVIVTGNDDI